uniref:Uncharacterized protein n=1 Tax=Lepeophtheirus salmonis TaxID=72036 RepID=A0A0K2URG1_LEPSM
MSVKIRHFVYEKNCPTYL